MGLHNSNDEVYVEANDGLLINLSKKKEELSSIDAELVGIWKISMNLLTKLKKHHSEATDGTKKDYEIAIASLSKNAQSKGVKDRRLGLV